MVRLSEAERERRRLAWEMVKNDPHGTVGQMARMLGLDYGNLHRWLRKNGFDVAAMAGRGAGGRASKMPSFDIMVAATEMFRREADAAAALGVDKSIFRRWRRSLGLRATGHDKRLMSSAARRAEEEMERLTIEIAREEEEKDAMVAWLRSKTVAEEGSQNGGKDVGVKLADVFESLGGRRLRKDAVVKARARRLLAELEREGRVKVFRREGYRLGLWVAACPERGDPIQPRGDVSP